MFDLNKFKAGAAATILHRESKQPRTCHYVGLSDSGHAVIEIAYEYTSAFFKINDDGTSHSSEYTQVQLTPIHKLGNRYQRRGLTYILCMPRLNELVLIDLRDGHRWTEKPVVYYGDTDNIPDEVFDKVCGNAVPYFTLVES